jgi:5'-phosphate synthase pdxT subunit
MIIGILALQGAFEEHEKIFNKIDPKIKTILIKKQEDVEICDGVVLPGGESTSMSFLEKDIFQAVREHINKKKPVWGTCAGMILLANNIVGKIEGQKNIGGLDITIHRNFFGSQLNSFISPLNYPSQFNKKGTFPAVFIRGPVIMKIGSDVSVLNVLDSGCIVSVQQENILGTSFHPELTNDNSWHEYFIELIKKYLSRFKDIKDFQM